MFCAKKKAAPYRLRDKARLQTEYFYCATHWVRGNIALLPAYTKKARDAPLSLLSWRGRNDERERYAKPEQKRSGFCALRKSIALVR